MKNLLLISLISFVLFSCDKGEGNGPVNTNEIKIEERFNGELCISNESACVRKQGENYILEIGNQQTSIFSSSIEATYGGSNTYLLTSSSIDAPIMVYVKGQNGLQVNIENTYYSLESNPNVSLIEMSDRVKMFAILVSLGL